MCSFEESIYRYCYSRDSSELLAPHDDSIVVDQSINISTLPVHHPQRKESFWLLEDLCVGWKSVYFAQCTIVGQQEETWPTTLCCSYRSDMSKSVIELPWLWTISQPIARHYPYTIDSMSREIPRSLLSGDRNLGICRKLFDIEQPIVEHLYSPSNFVSGLMLGSWDQPDCQEIWTWQSLTIRWLHRISRTTKCRYFQFQPYTWGTGAIGYFSNK